MLGTREIQNTGALVMVNTNCVGDTQFNAWTIKIQI